MERKEREEKQASKQNHYMQQLSSTHIHVFWSWIYSLPTIRLSSSLPPVDGLFLVLRLLRQRCTRQAHARDVLSTKLADLDYHCPSLYPGFPQSSTDVQRFLHDHCCSLLCSFPSYGMVQIPRWSPNQERCQLSRHSNTPFLGFCISRRASLHDGPPSHVQVYKCPHVYV